MVVLANSFPFKPNPLPVQFTSVLDQFPRRDEARRGRASRLVGRGRTAASLKTKPPPPCPAFRSGRDGACGRSGAGQGRSCELHQHPGHEQDHEAQGQGVGEFRGDAEQHVPPVKQQVPFRRLFHRPFRPVSTISWPSRDSVRARREPTAPQPTMTTYTATTPHPRRKKTPLKRGVCLNVPALSPAGRRGPSPRSAQNPGRR